VFAITKTGKKKTLYSFAPWPDGQLPEGGLYLDKNGNLFGTTSVGGFYSQGFVFELSNGTEKWVHSFAGGPDAQGPFGNLVPDATGNLYGITTGGGIFGQGTVFKVDSNGTVSIVYAFRGGDDGAVPSGVIADAGGNLYGTTFNGGSDNCGVVFKIDPSEHETIIYTFSCGSDGKNPTGAPARDAAGNLYGTTFYGGFAPGTAGYGTVFKVDTTGHESTLYTFTGGTDGANPPAGVTLDSSGNLYGTTLGGGSAGFGVVYGLSKSGKLSVFHAFTGGVDGAASLAPLLRDSAGNLYGTTLMGGALNMGVVFQVRP
jgi:uncharacterized repeat protein (TIGR03803 family)